MVSGTSRRIAVPMVVACFGVFGAAEAAHAAGGLSVTPAILEHRAALGTVGSLTLNNTTNETLQVTVNVRPWRQELNGKVLTDPRATFNRYVRATRRSFTLGAGAKVPVTFRMVRRTGSGSLYGNVDILGKPTRTKGRKGIIPQYRLISSLRLHPRAKTIKLRTGAARSATAPSCCRSATSATRSTRSPAPTGCAARLAQRHHQERQRRARQARRARADLDVRLQEGPLHDHRLALAGRQALQRAHERHAPLAG